MKYIIDFYQDLDTLNLIIFWGVITIIILLVIVIFILEKNKKNFKKNNSEEKVPKESLPIKEDISEIKESLIETTQPLNQVPIDNPTESFNAEEHVIEYQNHYQDISKVKEPPLSKNLNSNNQDAFLNEKESLPNKPYQRNVLREMSLSQTSPIGIIKNNPSETKDNVLAKELHESLNIEKLDDELDDFKYSFNENDTIPHINNSKIENNKLLSSPSAEITNDSLPKVNPYPPHVEIVNSVPQSHESISTNAKLNDRDNYSQTGSMPKQPSHQEEHPSLLESISVNSNNIVEPTDENSPNKSTYLEEVSSKLANSQSLDYIDRTDYELKQEEEAIISYEELMQKKDQIKMIDEEEAIISIEELLQKQKKDEKLYQLTDEEENDKFIRELKDFRNDL